MKRGGFAASICLLALVACSDGAGPPAPAALIFVTPPGAAAQTMIPLATQPILQLVDLAGNSVARAGVVVDVRLLGAGRIAAGATATTDAFGTAAFEGLTLGANNGEVGSSTLEFVANGLGSATAATVLTCGVAEIEVGMTVSDSVSTADCKAADGAFMKEYRLDVESSTKAIRLSHSGTFPASLLIRGPTAALFAGLGGGEDFDFKVFVPPGISRVMEAGFSDGMTGRFTFHVASAPEDEAECEGAVFALVLFPFSTNQTLRSECLNAAGAIADVFDFLLEPEATLSVSLSSTAFEPLVALRSSHPTDALIATGTPSGNTSSLTYANESGIPTFYYLVVTSPDGARTGAYTVIATVSDGGAAGLRSDGRAVAEDSARLTRRPSAAALARRLDDRGRLRMVSFRNR